MRLEDVYMIPPISVLDVKQKRWKDRRRFWLNLGIESELGRESNLLGLSELLAKKQNRTSIFDPVLCEIMYKWFTKENDSILDPFAGGSVRGIVASHCKRNYTGIDLSSTQLEHNRQQAQDLCQSHFPEWLHDDAMNVKKLKKTYDFMFTCPPYYDLEVYSNDKRDLSAMKSYAEFRHFYETIIYESCKKLKENSFAVFVVGEVRENGNYVGLASDTVRAFKNAGLNFYNEMILLQEPATAALRSDRFMNASRKIAKCHQNVLMFIKGDAKKIAERLGPVTIEKQEESILFELFTKEA